MQKEVPTEKAFVDKESSSGLEVITTHVNADFDAFGSMVAAKKLYPEALVAFPGSQEKNLRDFFMESTLYILSIERARDIDLSAVKRLILVDTRQKSRIGRFAALAESRGVEIHIYDHHPDSDDDVHGDLEIVHTFGSTVTLLLGKIRERGLELSAEEATILALGVYEDTGAFTFSSTTPADLEAAGWLLSRGANLNIIANMLATELDRGQVEVLHQLIQEAENLIIGGIEVTVTTAGAENYVGDLAVLVHKFKDMEGLNALFAVVRMEDRVHLIARSNLDEVNAGEIAAEFGGGGHPTAASATIRNMSLYEAREKLVAVLHERVRPKRRAGEIMSRPVYTVPPEYTIAEASLLMGRYQVSSLPVVRNEAVLGIVHRNAVEKAIHHGLETESVFDYMNPGVVFVTPDESIDRVISMSVEGRHRLIAVMDEGRMVGVISRSDLLEHLKLPKRSDSAGPEEYPTGRMRSRSVRKLMEERLPNRVLALLRRAGEVAESRGEDVYLVGGAVRDLFLRNHNLDLDLVVEGDGIRFSWDLAGEYPGSRVRSHEKFATAVIRFEDAFKVDVATARHEYYARPGALPTVETSSIKRDLFRRDFTINTLAVNLNPRTIGKVIDFFGAARDIKERIVRVLHNLAFVEDPTRIMRAVRFSSRFGFSIGKHTLTLMKGAVKMNAFDKVEGKRLLNELIHILEEKYPLPALIMMDSLRLWQALHPAFTFTEKVRALVEAVSGALSWWKYQFLQEDLEAWLVYFLALSDPLPDEEFESVLKRFSITLAHPGQLRRQRLESRLVLAAFARGQIQTKADVVRELHGFSPEILVFMMARTTRVDTRKAISLYINRLRHVHPLLTGKDLIDMGYTPGPLFGRILKVLREARLNERIASLEEEQELVRRLFPPSSGALADASPTDGGAEEIALPHHEGNVL